MYGEIKTVDEAKRVTGELLAKYSHIENVIDFIDTLRANKELATDTDYLIVWGRALRVLRGVK